ncbi:hypothetical protein KY290_033232 [Solanum tuberosum]|uniref:Uncharacterized protein n=1 Tax=Solanum tuberosum TaxID=4113 RepID=A0ABQ7U0U2_SOLTU|nr:hypothetical protein KY285_032491 [Solanum tuberosum]KAH0740189.1 hypothetical protein KY290_033232 [Solanum tuberosum]
MIPAVGGLLNVVPAWNWPEMEKKGLVVVTEKWWFGGCFGGVSLENGENEWELLELDLWF